MEENQKPTYDELVRALEALVLAPAFTGALFERDKESHRAWTMGHVVHAKLIDAGYFSDQG